MDMKKTGLILAALFAAAAVGRAALAGEGPAQAGAPKGYAWASKPLEGALWAIAVGDCDGDGRQDAALLERRGVRIGRIVEGGFEEDYRCGWKGGADGARIYMHDLDGDGKDELVIAAVEDGMPASLALRADAEGRACSQMLSDVRLSIRVVGWPGGGKKLLGQGWTTQAFFAGHVRELAFEGGRLKQGARVDLPRNVGIYQFAPLPDGPEGPAVAILKGPGNMEVRERRQGKWKRAWRSPERLGGTTNVLPAEQRPALDEVASYFARFDPPAFAAGPGIVAPKADMPMREAIGRTPFVKGGEILGYRPDPALGYTEAWRTLWLPGAIEDTVLNGDGRLVVLIQDAQGPFETATSSKLVGFDL
jgi:hypothetical protein